MVTSTLVSHNYTYQDVLDNSKKVAWTGRRRPQRPHFDLSKRFLPNRLSGVDDIAVLNEEEKRTLNQIMGNAYLPPLRLRRGVHRPDRHGGVPRTLRTATKYGSARSCASRKRSSSTRSCSAARSRCSTQQFGITPQLIPGREEVAAVVRSKSQLAVLILIDIIEWFVQVHYTEHVLARPISTTCSATC